MMKKILKNFDWVNFLRIILSIIFLFYINFYLIDSYVLKERINQLSEPFQENLNFGFIAYLLSIIGISFYLVKNLSKAFFIKLVSGYFIYQIVSYFILVTRNLNNEKFKVWDLTNNHFFQPNFLVTFLIIIGISGVLYFLIQKNRHLAFIKDYLQDYDSKNIILFGLLASFTVNDRQMLKIFKELVLSFLSNDDYVQFMTHLSSNLFLSLVTMGIISYLVLDSYQGIATNTPTPSVMVTVSLLLAIIFNYTLQLGVKSDEALLGNFIFPGATAYQIIVLTLLFLVIYLVVNRFLSATLFIIVIGVIISVVNNIKVGLRSEPLLITDFVWLKEFSLITSFVDKSVIVYTLLGVAFVIVVYFLLRKVILPGKLFLNNKLRFSILGILTTIGILNFIIFRNEADSKVIDNVPIISRVNNCIDINWMGFSKNASYKSMMYVWTKQLTKSVMDSPKGYSEDKIRKIVEKYRNEASVINATRDNKIEDQTVIFVLSESFSDPSRIPGISLSKNVIPNITQIKDSYTSGLMKSDFYGGGTANMEIQALTGLSYSNLSSSVSVMNTEVLPKMSYVPSISDSYDDKNKIAVHFHNASNYSRNIVYKDFGFRKFVALDGTKDKPTQLEFLSAGAKDSSTYYAVTSNLTKNTNQFFSVITMQNHVPWNSEQPTDVTAYGDGLSNSENDSLTSYARLLSVTDTATADFLNELSNYDKKITVVFYGDHLPGLYPSKVFSNNPSLQYETDYFIWSNYETDKLNYPVVSSSDFSALLLEQTGSKVSPYYALLTDILEAKNQSSDNLEALLMDLKMLQYDLTLGKSYITKLDKKFFN
ncbi:LTA synthase family protein [Streptococcus equinus]|uniref:LTA synthase family protein n=1 Tax=Streptococcus equinus TaxID=1335 RepID=UPI001FB1DC7B|nr:LTA synthase family protein [Streptococcus equinus]UOC10496.1 LTA synthase family protein [Streptococcus equinus]